MIKVPLTQGKVAVIDDEDARLILPHRWHAKRRLDHLWYAISSFKLPSGTYRNVGMHQIIMPVLPGFTVDHIDRDGLNNRRANLRPADRRLQAANRRPKKTGRSRFKGVFLYPRSPAKPWRMVFRSGPRVWRSFATEIEAAAAYNELVRKHSPGGYLNDLSVPFVPLTPTQH